ncbi:MAG: GbsR/MarR family transcriptional regulator [bacterium]
MNEIQTAIVEDFGSGYVKFGHSELMGQVVGLLLCEIEPLSIDEICLALHVTKTPINQICRRLEELKLIRRIRIKGERKYHYQISPNLFLQAGMNLTRLYEENLNIAEYYLPTLLQKYARALPEEKDRLKVMCERLIAMREFHIREIESYKRFLQEWKRTKIALPSVEEYMSRMGTKAA